MVENTKTKKTIIWLEDHSDYFPELQQMIGNLGFDLIICPTLEEFKKATDIFKDEPQLVAGFIIDVALRGNNNNNLSDLGLDNIMTHRGGVTGIQVVIHFLLALHSKDESPFANTPISILTVLEDSDKVFSSLASPSPYARDKKISAAETSAAVSKVKFIYKQEDSALNGDQGGTSAIKQWLNRLRG